VSDRRELQIVAKAGLFHITGVNAPSHKNRILSGGFEIIKQHDLATHGLCGHFGDSSPIRTVGGPSW
jgi:hypothetical protein